MRAKVAVPKPRPNVAGVGALTDDEVSCIPASFWEVVLGWRYNIFTNLTGKPRNANFYMALADMRANLRSTD